MSTHTSTTRGRVRYYRRSATPTLAFVPYGLIPLLCLLGIGAYGATHFASVGIEDEVEDAVTDRLAAEGLSWVDVEVDGQAVHLSGAGEPSEGQRAIELARASAGPTAFGALTAPISVDGEFTPDDVPSAPVEQVEEEPAAPPAWGDVVATHSAQATTLTGVVASDEVRTELGERAAAGEPPVEVRNLLEVGDEPLNDASAALARRAIEPLAACTTGEARVTQGVLSFTCTLPEASAADVRAAVEAPLTEGTLGAVEILVEEQIDACEHEMSELLSGQTIEFATGSAQVHPRSGPLLDRVAEVAGTCPGHLRVEGHTDDVGDAASNLELSRARASSIVEALVERGVGRDRLVPEGFGPNRPREEGTSAAARARNRRIELHVITPSTGPEGND